MVKDIFQRSRRIAICAPLLLPLTAAQALTFPDFPSTFPGGTGGTSGSTTATLILTCGVPATAAAGSTSTGSCNCSQTGSGGVSCSCTSGSTGGSGTGTFGFSASSNTPATLLTKLRSADSCAEAKALIESGSGRSAGACSLTSAGSLAPLLFACDIGGGAF